MSTYGSLRTITKKKKKTSMDNLKFPFTYIGNTFVPMIPN